MSQPRHAAAATAARGTGAERKAIQQWTVRLSQALIAAVKAQVTAEGKEPSPLVEEILWQALTDRQPETL